MTHQVAIPVLYVRPAHLCDSGLVRRGAPYAICCNCSLSIRAVRASSIGLPALPRPPITLFAARASPPALPPMHLMRAQPRRDCCAPGLIVRPCRRRRRSLYNNIRAPSQLAAQTTFYLFKEHIEPKWEDPSNAAGGCWTVQTPRGPVRVDAPSCSNTVAPLYKNHFGYGLKWFL